MVKATIYITIFDFKSLVNKTIGVIPRLEKPLSEPNDKWNNIDTQDFWWKMWALSQEH